MENCEVKVDDCVCLGYDKTHGATAKVHDQDGTVSAGMSMDEFSSTLFVRRGSSTARTLLAAFGCQPET